MQAVLVFVGIVIVFTVPILLYRWLTIRIMGEDPMLTSEKVVQRWAETRNQNK